jgi:hypothetical protein
LSLRWLFRFRALSVVSAFPFQNFSFCRGRSPSCIRRILEPKVWTLHPGASPVLAKIFVRFKLF